MVNNDVLQHYGILGMKWGVRKIPTQRNKRVNKQNIKRNTKRVVRTVGLSVVSTIAVNALLANSNATSRGRNFVNSYLKQNGHKTVNQLNINKSWADYAWEEINKF